MDNIKRQCGNCKEYEPFLKRSKGELKVMCDGGCRLLELYKKRTNTCKMFGGKII